MDSMELAAFEGFYRQNYRLLVRIALYLGASKDDAEDAANEAMTEVFQRWAQITNPPAYARRAMMSNLWKARERGLTRLRSRLHARGEGRQEGGEDAGLSVWEDKQWVKELLSSLPRAQQEVMALMTDEFTSAEIAARLGKNPPAIRQNLATARRRLDQMLRQQEHPAARSARAAVTTLEEVQQWGTAI